jgi:hypothetical protein
MKVTAVSVGMGVAATMSLSLVLLSNSQSPAVADVWTNAPQTMHLVAPLNLPDAVKRISRDPFALSSDDAGDQSKSTSSPNVSMAPNAATAIVPPGTVSPSGLVPNPGGGVDVAAAGILPQNGDAQISVVGTVVGGSGRPVALVKNGSEIDYVHVGDYLGSRRVTGIYAQGIEFSDGSRLAIATSNASQQRDLTKSPASASPITPASNTDLDAAQAVQAERAAQGRGGYVPLPPGAVPTLNPSQTALPTVTSAPYDPSATTNPYNPANPNPQGTPHYNSTTPVPAPAPPSH